MMEVTKTTRSEAARSTAWSVVSQGSQILLGLASVALLSRWLSPADYGEVAMAGSLTALVGFIGDSGITSALSRRAQVSRETEAAAFWIAISGAILLSALCALGAPVLGWHFRSGRVALLAAALSTMYVIAAPSRIPIAQLARTLRFRALAGVNAASVAAGIGAGASAALHGLGPWSLVIQQLTTFATQSLVGQLVCPTAMRPSLAKRGHAKELARQGMQIGGYGLAVSLSRAIDPAVAGPAFGAGPLGAVGLALRLLHVPSSRIATAITNVFLPIVIRLRPGAEQARAFGGATRMALLVITPVAFGIPAIGGPLIALLPARWGGVIEYLPIVGAIALSEPITQLSTAILTASGRTSMLLRVGIALVPLGWASAIAGGYASSMRWMLVCVLGWYVIQSTLLFRQAARTLGRAFDLHALLARPIACGAAMFLGVRAVLSTAALSTSASGIPVGLLVGSALYLPAAFFFQNGAWCELLAMLRALGPERQVPEPGPQA